MRVSPQQAISNILIHAFTSQEEVGNSRFQDDVAITEYPYDAGVGSRGTFSQIAGRLNKAYPDPNAAVVIRKNKFLDAEIIRNSMAVLYDDKINKRIGRFH